MNFFKWSISLSKRIIEGVISSFDNHTQGFSARKICAFITMFVVVVLHYNFVDKDNVVTVIEADFLFVLMLLGIITAEQLIKLKSGVKADSTIPPSNQIADTTIKTEAKIDEPAKKNDSENII